MTEHGWSDAWLDAFAATQELEIAVRRLDGTLRAAVPVWVVTADGDVFVRTWYRRDTGWYGRAVRSRRAHVRMPGAEAEVSVTEVGATGRLRIDAAYRAKYGAAGGTGRMVADEAVATTLRLDPDD